jgi:hypothetical protein
MNKSAKILENDRLNFEQKQSRATSWKLTVFNTSIAFFRDFSQNNGKAPCSLLLNF